jgi:hypothetical protein
MKRTLIVAAATFALAMPAFAAVITIDTGAPVAPAAGAPPAAPAPAAGTLLATFTPKAADAMLATGQTTDAEVAAIAAVKDVTKVTVRQVKLGTAADAGSVSKIKADRAADITRLQVAINANAAFKGELAAKMVDVATIVAVEVAGDGTLTLYSLS